MGGQELERQIPATIPNIVTGEIVSTADTAAMAGYLKDIREHEQSLRTLKGMISDVIIQAARELGTKTLHLPPYTAKIAGGPKIVWDVEKLRELVAAGLPEKRFAELVKETVDYKVNALVANQIAGANPTYAEIIEAARGEEPGPEYVTISGS